MTTVVSYDTSRCRATAVSCDGSEVSYDGGVVRRTTHSCDAVLEDYVTRINSLSLTSVGGDTSPLRRCVEHIIITTINRCQKSRPYT